MAFGGDDDSNVASSASRQPASSYAAPEPSSTQAAAPPLPTDFAVDVVVTEQKCYGSAGCNYQLSVNPRYVGVGDLTDDQNVMVVYEIVGGDDPQQGNFRLEGGNIRWDQDKRIQGPAGAQFTANVLQVLPQY